MAEPPSPKFSIIMVDFDGSVTRDEFRRAVECINAQTFTDFELLIYHDGPRSPEFAAQMQSIDYPEKTRLFETEARENNWGHSNRNRGIHAANGEWIVHTNADNIHYPEALEEIAKVIDSDMTTFVGRRFNETSRKDIVVFPILMREYVPFRTRVMRKPGRNEFAHILSGIPVKIRNIDLMQFVMRRQLWLEEGGWSDVSKNSDGKLYQQFATKYAVYPVNKVLGEHY